MALLLLLDPSTPAGGAVSSVFSGRALSASEAVQASWRPEAHAATLYDTATLRSRCSSGRAGSNDTAASCGFFLSSPRTSCSASACRSLGRRFARFDVVSAPRGPALRSSASLHGRWPPRETCGVPGMPCSERSKLGCRAERTQHSISSCRRSLKQAAQGRGQGGDV